jgi:hypothetical protein
MSILPDALRAYEQELLQKADMLALALTGLRAAAPERAAAIVEAITARLAGAATGDSADAGQTDAGMGAAGVMAGDRARGERGEPRRPGPVVIAARGGGSDDVEDFILDILAENPRGLSVQDIVDSLDAAQIEIKRKTLVVRLHRMVQAGRIAAQAHGHYTLSEAERSRRRA